MNIQNFTKNILWAVGAWLILAMPGKAEDSSTIPALPSVPDALQVSPKEELLFAAKAKGFQIYTWQPKKDNPSQSEWVFKAPEADLFDDSGKKIGHHYAGPTWESTDGSKVVGALKNHVAPKDENAVPWLLLTAKDHAGSGTFSHVTSIQRLETVGGKAPSAGPTTTDTEVRVPYTATYYFYGSKT